MQLILIILDGWGVRAQTKGNAIKLAKTPHMDKLWKTCPHTTLAASGTAVGLPKGYMGNSEVGHTTIGAGRIIPSEELIIDKAIKNKSFYKNKEFLNAIKHVKKNKSALHLLGLISDKGVHSHINHLKALCRLAKKHKIKYYIHAILDGRDSPPKSAQKYLNQLHSLGKVVSLTGRYYAMDRDNRWKRTKKAYDALINTTASALPKISDFYKQGFSDEFIPPVSIRPIQHKDAVIFFNHRPDRARQLTKAFLGKKGCKKLKNIYFVAMTEYDKKLNIPFAFKKQRPKKTFPEVIKTKQLHIAETEKYAHITYFFGREKPFPKEKRILIPSPKISTYDKRPEMSAKKITNRLLKELHYPFIIVNFANGDMVGHTGNLKATIKAVQIVDQCVGKIVKAAKNHKIIITADHGNCENIIGPGITSHNTSKVPFILVNHKAKLRKTGGLQDIAPTMLELMGYRQPKVMTGKSLILQ